MRLYFYDHTVISVHFTEISHMRMKKNMAVYLKPVNMLIDLVLRPFSYSWLQSVIYFISLLHAV